MELVEPDRAVSVYDAPVLLSIQIDSDYLS